MKNILLIIVLLFQICLFAQENESLNPLTQITSDSDSLMYVRLEQINVFPQKGKKMNYRRYTRLVAKIRKVYPFALDAAKELEKYNKKFENTKIDREKRKYVRHIEKFLFDKYEDDLRKFTVSEGRYLMLLIDRETGNVSYSIIKEIKGGVPAVFWQGIAKLFNNDLKEKYDPIYKHYVIEQIVLMIEEENNNKKKK